MELKAKDMPDMLSVLSMVVSTASLSSLEVSS